MAAVTLEITPDLETRLRQEAEREGLDPEGFILRQLRQLLVSDQDVAAPRLSSQEAELLQKINRGLPAATWRHYGELKEKRREESLTASEQAELIALSDNIEAMNVRRMESVIQLARLRQVSVDALMGELGIKSPMYA